MAFALLIEDKSYLLIELYLRTVSITPTSKREKQTFFCASPTDKRIMKIKACVTQRLYAPNAFAFHIIYGIIGIHSSLTSNHRFLLTE